MFDIFRRVQGVVDSVVAKIIARVVMGVLFLIGAGFALAALATLLSQWLGPVAAYALLAAVFIIGGAIAAATLGREKKPEVSAAEARALEATDRAPRASFADWVAFLDVMKVVAPVAAPILMRLAFKKRPLLVMGAAGLAFALLQRSSAQQQATGRMEPPASSA